MSQFFGGKKKQEKEMYIPLEYSNHGTYLKVDGRLVVSLGINILGLNLTKRMMLRYPVHMVSLTEHAP